MGKEKKRFEIVGLDGIHYLMTAKELYEQVMKDSLSDFNWIASATQIVIVCNKKRFPKKYANKIMVAILDSFTNMEFTKDQMDEFSELSMEEEAAYYCYYNLPDTDSNCITTKRRYLFSIIESVARFHYEIPVHPGSIKFNKLCSEWIASKFEEYSKENIKDIDLLIRELHKDFKNTIRNAEQQGLFKEEDEQFFKSRKEYWSRSIYEDDGK